MVEYTYGVLTSSDMGARGQREDTSGQLIQQALQPPQFELRRYVVVPDEKELIQTYLVHWADKDGLDLVITTGGTGLSARDVTPEATLQVVDRHVPGIAEAIRTHGMAKTPMAMLGRGISGVRERTLIVNLPGSPKAVQEALEALLPVLPHAIQLLRGTAQGHPR